MYSVQKIEFDEKINVFARLFITPPILLCVSFIGFVVVNLYRDDNV